MKLKLTNNLTKVETILDVNDNKVSSTFYNFNLTLPAGMPDGEYSYSLLSDEGASYASGLVQIGDFVEEKKEYNEKEEYIVYGEE